MAWKKWLMNKKVTATYDENKSTIDRIKKAISDWGYGISVALRITEG
jgi:copper chaperone CopZ